MEVVAACHILGFTNLEYVDKGAQGKVYKADHPKHKTVAIKVPDRLFEANVEREFKLMMENKHPNIVEMIDSIRTNTFLCIVMEYCAKGSLQAYVTAHKGPIPESICQKLMGQMASGMGPLWAVT